MATMLQTKLSRGFSLFGIGGGGGGGSNFNKTDPARRPPSLKLQTDKNVYRPGDPVVITIEIQNPHGICSLLVERLGFEIKGIEKLDTNWFSTPKPDPVRDSKQTKGEYVFMDYSTTSIVSNQLVSSGTTKTYVVRTLLPSVIPPSYRGATIRYHYYIRSTLSGQYLMLEPGQSHGESRDLPELEARIAMQIWVTQKTNSLLYEDGQTDGIVPATTILLDVYWKERDTDSDWARANETCEGVEEDYESSRDEVSSVSSYNPTKESVHKTFGSSFSLQSYVARSSNKDASYIKQRSSISSYMPLPRLAVAEVLYDSTGGDESSIPSPPEAVENVPSEDFIRGRSYNIRLDDQVLLRFSPKNSESTYYFSDMIGGTLKFFHEERAQRCLELSITLEMSETINGHSIHHSRRNSPTITKVQSDHHEVVADLVQTSFLFSIPMDGPMSFSTRHVSVQWSLRFEFLTTPKNVDWTRFEHPLLIEGRDKCEWVLPITVHAPSQVTSAAHMRNEKSFSLEPLWVRT